MKNPKSKPPTKTAYEAYDEAIDLARENLLKAQEDVRAIAEVAQRVFTEAIIKAGKDLTVRLREEGGNRDDENVVG